MASLSGIVKHALTGKVATEGAVRVFLHKDRDDRNIQGKAGIGSDGRFKITWARDAPPELTQNQVTWTGPWIFLHVFDKRGRLIHQTSPRKGRERFGQWEILISDRRPPDVSIVELRKTLGIAQNVETKLADEGILRVTQLLKPDGRKVLKSLSLADEEKRKLMKSAEIALVTGDASIAKRLLDSGTESVIALANRSSEAVIKELKETGPVSDEEAKSLAQSKALATAVSEVLKDDRVRMSQSSKGHWPTIAPTVPDIPIGVPDSPEQPEVCGECDSEDSVFSPLAYIYELVHFMDDNWQLGLEQLERLLLQELDRDASTFLEPVSA